MADQKSKLEKIISLAKRRGFVYAGSDIYGGLAGTWDYGPLGFLLKENIKRAWLKAMLKPHIYPLDSGIILNSKVWQASGHAKNFSDVLVECESCHERFREDQLEGKKGSKTCPNCGKNKFTAPRQFNLMFKTHAGPVEDASSEVYLRPETAQGIFINFKNVVDSFHPKLPFGIAQIGKAFRNEITPRNFLFRAREFEQMELEYFCDPKDAGKFFKDIRKTRMDWFLNLGVKKSNLRFHDYGKNELAHYAEATSDIEYRFGLSEDGFSELEGVANRTDFDLKSHFPEHRWINDDFIVPKEKKEGPTPYVIEPSVGVDRAFLVFLLDAYEEEIVKSDKRQETSDKEETASDKRVVLKLHPTLAPYKAAVFPLLANKPQLVELAHKVFLDLRESYMVAWDERGNIGKRYRVQDEAGTPYCITVDFDSLEKDDVTVRDRDSMKQERVKIKELKNYLNAKF